MDSILEDSIDENNLANLNDNLVDTIPEMFTDEYALDYSSPPLYDEYDDDLFEVESDTEYAYDDPFDSKGQKIKESKLLIDELDLPRSSDFLSSPEYDSFLFEDFFEADALPSTNNEDKVFNSVILIQGNLFEVITRVASDKNVKKLAIYHASLILKDFDLLLQKLPFHKEVPGSKTLLSFSSKNKEKVFKPGILTSKGVHFSLILELSHRGPKAFKFAPILGYEDLVQGNITINRVYYVEGLNHNLFSVIKGFDRECNEKKLIQMIKNYTDKNVAALLTKAFVLKVNAARHNLLLLVNVNSVEEQFWSTAVAKTINGEAQIHARVDGKKVIISEASIRRDLQLTDEEGVDCLPNSTIFEQLALISMGRNLDKVSRKFLMYLRFIQVFLDKQVDRISNHERKYISSSLTKKFFKNMRRIRKGFSRRITQLFPKMVVQSKMDEDSAIPTDPHHTPTILQTSSSQPQNTHKPREPTRKVTEVPQPSDPIEHVTDEVVHKELGDKLMRAATTASSLEAEHDSGNTLRNDEDRMKLNEFMELCTNLQNRVLDLEKTKTTQANEIDSLKRRVKKLERRSKSKTHKLKRLYKIGLTARVESTDNEESLGEDACK
nr:hypothetical protein [Tanacetum cinerariifolium]